MGVLGSVDGFGDDAGDQHDRVCLREGDHAVNQLIIPQFAVKEAVAFVVQLWIYKIVVLQFGILNEERFRMTNRAMDAVDVINVLFRQPVDPEAKTVQRFNVI